MKSTITNIFLGTFILISGSVMSQDNAIQKQPFGLESTVSGNLLNPSVSEAFKANIYPNPTLIGKVKMNWPDWAEVTEIQMVLASTNEMKIINVEEGQTHVTASNLQEGVYIVRFIHKNEVLGMRKLKVIG
ncbi:MAG: hypothetical protein ISP70_01260 [Crocinitomicaceae bacterium]|nr:hypothetical protein [Crocinitomicaceae bacterium]